MKILNHPLDKIFDDIPGGSAESIPRHIAESVAIYFGAWEYSKKFFLIPIWLPLLWGIGALIVENMSETLLETVPEKTKNSILRKQRKSKSLIFTGSKIYAVQ